jgi:hypothetical protein
LRMKKFLLRGKRNKCYINLIWPNLSAKAFTANETPFNLFVLPTCSCCPQMGQFFPQMRLPANGTDRKWDTIAYKFWALEQGIHAYYINCYFVLFIVMRANVNSCDPLCFLPRWFTTVMSVLNHMQPANHCHLTKSFKRLRMKMNVSFDLRPLTDTVNNTFVWDVTIVTFIIFLKCYVNFE